MIEGVMIDDEGYRKYAPNKGPERASFLSLLRPRYTFQLHSWHQY